jgi:choline dehydrogenase-like flavoprotein
MIIDTRTIDSDLIQTEVCIIGSGPAGLSLAREFLGTTTEVALLESGGLVFDADIQALAEGQTFGDSVMSPGDVCNRQVGGNSSVWIIKIRSHEFGVRYVPFDEIDFEERSWVNHSGWPFDRNHLLPYYKRAQEVCSAGPFSYHPVHWENDQIRRMPLDHNTAETGVFQFGPGAIFYEHHRKEIQASSNITLYTHTTATEIVTDDSGKRITKVRFGNLDGKSFSVSAKVFVLAGGGFQNARLLLASNQQQPAGLGNYHDVVGRYYHDHPQILGSYFKPFNSAFFNQARLYDLRQVNGVPVMGFLRLSKEIQAREGLLNMNTFMFPRPTPRQTKGITSLKYLGESALGRQVRSASAYAADNSMVRKSQAENIPGHLWNIAIGLDYVLPAVYLAKAKNQSLLHGLGRGGWSEIKDNSRRFYGFEVQHFSEQSPNPENRVRLSRERDALGCPKLELHWRWNPDDGQRICRGQEVLAQELRRAGLGELTMQRDEAGQPLIGRPTGAAHLMGTTRMHNDPKEGVVDANCRVHGIANLFIAGSSTFPTGGYANPTLTIVAMSLRMADLLKQELNHNIL